MKSDRVALGVVGCLGLFGVGVVAAVVVVLVWLLPAVGSLAESESSTEPERRPWEALPVPPCSGVPGTANELVEPLRLHDPARIDLAELYDQARPLVLRLEPDAKLVSLAPPRVAAGGTYDIAEGSLSATFEYRCLRVGAPPGQDLHEGILLVITYQGNLRVNRMLDPVPPGLVHREAPPEPPCSTVAAWATAVASGVPGDARATFVFGSATGSARGSSWLITVPGHPFRREVNGETCRLRAHSALNPDLEDPGAVLPELHPTALPAAGAAGAVPSSAATPVVPPAEPASEPAPGSGGNLVWERVIETADMKAVDVGELFPQARGVAEKLQPGAQFTGLVAFETEHGKADLTGEGRVVYKFEMMGHDPSQPPGKDAIERAIDVTAQRGKLRGARRDWPAVQLKHLGGAIEPPVCTSGRAWEAAVKSGVPDNAVARLHYYDHKAFTPGTPWVWSVRVDGHDEHRREIDGKTCALVKSWGAAPSGAR